MGTAIPYFRRRTSEERTAALQARTSAPRDASRAGQAIRRPAACKTAHEQRLGLELTRSEPPSRFINHVYSGEVSPRATASTD
jgi:hypothetical protein